MSTNSVKEKGFTILELLLVMLVISVLATLFMSSYPAVQKRSRDTRRVNDIKQYQVALEAYANKTANNGSYINSPSVSNIVDQCTTLGLPSDSCPDDSTYSYRYISNGTQYIVFSRLEQKNGTLWRYFVSCSNGNSGIYESSNATNPLSSSNCPALTAL